MIVFKIGGQVGLFRCHHLGRVCQALMEESAAPRFAEFDRDLVIGFQFRDRRLLEFRVALFQDVRA